MFKKFTTSLIGFSGMLLLAQLASAGPAVLVENGKARFTIVTDEKPNQATEDAVRELNYWVKNITGTTLPVTTTARWTGSTSYIAVGSSELTRKNGWENSPFKQEEARIFVEENRIGLVGNDNAIYPEVTWEGTYYAVLELVQKEFGVRWIWPGKSGEVFEKKRTLALPEKSWSWAPTITAVRQLRNGYQSTAIPEKLKTDLNIDVLKNNNWARLRNEHNQWLKRQRMNRSSNIRFGHAFGNWWEKYSKKHPDWFAKPPGDLTQRGGKGVKLNISNPEVHEQIIKNWHSKWKKDPSAHKFLNVSPNDSRGFDTRPETRAWDPPELQRFSDKEIYNGDEPILTDRYVKLWNLLAKRVREIDPEAHLATYAYRNYQKPPLAEKTVENNIVVGYVGGEGYYPDERNIVKEWVEWSDKGAKLFWRPNLFHTGHGTQHEYSRTLYNDFHTFQKNSLLGFDFDTLTGNWAGQGLSYYIVAEMSSRPEATYEELSQEYFGAFGPAADSVRKYTEYFEGVTQKAPQLLRDHKLVPHHTWGGWWPAHVRLVPLFLTPEVVAHAETLLQQAEQDVSQAAPIYKERLSTIQKGFQHSKIMAETFRKLQLENPKVKSSYRDKKEVLQPLWDYRQTILTDISVATVRLFSHEQRIFKLWDAFAQQQIEEQKHGFQNAQLIDLVEEWRFLPDPAAGKDVHKIGFDDTSWRKMSANDWWQRQGFPDYHGTAWYRKTFETPALKTGQKAMLQFQGVDGTAEVFLNDQKIGTHVVQKDFTGWDEPFSFDVTKTLRPGKNTVAVKVESKSLDTASGINQPVTLLIGIPPGETYPLQKGWEFRNDPNNQGLREQWNTLQGEKTHWASIKIAQPWRESLPGIAESKIGWYRLNFEVPNLSDTGEKVLLRFNSVDSETRMWVNGIQVNERGYPHNGNYDSWNEVFEVDITDAVKAAAQNTLAIRVESEKKNAGITGDVSLILRE